MNVYLTGANGYLGGWLLKELLDAGHNVHAVSAHGDLVHGYGCGQERLTTADVIVHLAWYSSAGDSCPHLHERCLHLTEGLAKQIHWLDNHIPLVSGESRRLIFTSTASVYGHCPDRECTEAHPVHPLCAYTRAKAAAEETIREKVRRHVIVRLGSLMGLGRTRTKTDLLVNGCAVDGYLRREIPISHPDSCKPILHVQDAARLLRLLVESPARCGTLNAAAVSPTVLQVAKLAGMLTASPVREVPGTCPERSIRLACHRLREWFPSLLFRVLSDTIQEFKDYVEKPTDRNIPWKN